MSIIVAEEYEEISSCYKSQIENTASDITYSNHLANYKINESGDRRFQITNLYLCGLVVSILLHILDVGTDLYLAYQYYEHDKKKYCYLTLCFIIFPAIINSLISTRMYIMDKTPATYRQWIFRIVSITLQFAPISRYFEALQYGIKLKYSKEDNNSLKYEKYYKPLLREDSNLSLLRVIECFLEAAPQQVLQIAILLHLERQNSINYLFQVYQYLTISTSLISIAWSFAIYNRSIRFARDDKRNMSWTGSFLQFAWLFLVTSSRILAISEVASVYPEGTFLACIMHCFIMTLWLSIYESPKFCSLSTTSAFKSIEKTMEVCFCAVLGMVYIFAFITPNEGHTRHKYIFYYSLCFAENTIAILIWCIFGDTKHWWFVPLLALSFFMFILGIILMLLYYTVYHPEIGLIRKIIRYKEPLDQSNDIKKSDKGTEVD